MSAAMLNIVKSIGAVLFNIQTKIEYKFMFLDKKQYYVLTNAFLAIIR